MFTLDDKADGHYSMSFLLNKPTANGRIYSAENFLPQKDRYRLLVCLGSSETATSIDFTLDFTFVCGSVDKMYVNADGDLAVDWHLLSTPAGTDAKVILEHSNGAAWGIAPSGIGRLEPVSIGADIYNVRDYRLSCFSLVYKK